MAENSIFAQIDRNNEILAQNSKLINQKFGAGRTTVSNIAPEGTGALANLSPSAAARLGGQDAIKDAVEIANQLKPKSEPFDPYLAALLFFTKMGEAASKPGATAIGAASVGAQEPLKYLMQKRKDERAAQAAVGPMAIQLVTAFDKQGAVGKKFYTNTKTGETIPMTQRQFNKLPDQNEWRPFKQPVRKSAARGDAPQYMKKEDAIKYLVAKGLPEDNDNFDRIVERISTDDPNKIGDPVEGAGGLALELIPVILGNQVQSFNFSPIPGTMSNSFRNKQKRLLEIAKTKTAHLNKGFNVIPSIDTALAVLRSGVKTGGLEAATLGFRQIATSLFGLDPKELEGQQMLESISNKLAPGMRPPGSGSTSDMEFNAFKSAVLTMKNTPFANYMSLWTLKKVTQNAAKATNLEEILLSSPKNYSQKYINDQIEKVDTGLYAKFKTLDADGKPIYKNENEKITAAKEFFANLPNGEVFINRDEKGAPVFTKGAGQKDDLFLIKGFKRRRGK